MKKTKIVATIGPATNTPEMLEKIFREGVDVARLNFSHGNLVEKKETIELIRKISTKIDKQIAIIADLPGPKLRLGEFDGIRKITKGENLTLAKDKKADLPIFYDFSDSVQAGQEIFLNDALVELKITSIVDGVVNTVALNDGWVSSKKGINLPDTVLKGDIFTTEDKEGALFAIKEKADFIAISFVQSVEDVIAVKELIKEKGSKIKVISKIEKPSAVNNIEAIIEASDAVIVARGDLAIETSPAEVPLIQQRIINICRQKQKPVIVATQMLESMIENPRPTRAEASDVANAVLSQVDAVMLSAESAAGKYPVEAVKVMSSIIETVEADFESRRYIKINWDKINLEEISVNAIVSASASLAYRLKSPAIGVGTVSGKTVRQLSSFRPSALIVACTHEELIARQLALSWGVFPALTSDKASFDTFDNTMLEIIRKHFKSDIQSIAVLVWGSEIGVSGTTDTIRTAAI